MFVQGRRYRRRSLHANYGGQRQGGISTPRDYPIVLIFTGQTGQQYGYDDTWTDEGIFEYTGEGQRGDMRIAKGNSAILRHAENGKDLHLFEAAGRAFVRYIGQMVCTGFETRSAPDVDGHPREAIVFHLVPIEATGSPPASVSRNSTPADLGLLWTMQMGELRTRATGEARSAVGRRQATRTTFERSEAIRVYVLRRADRFCEACGSRAPFTRVDGRPYLEPHHIRRLSDGGPDDPAWVAGVCPNCHRRAHHGEDGPEFNDGLAAKIQEKEAS